MNKLIVLAMLLLAAAAIAQSPKTPGPPADMEPGVNTSAPSAATQPPDPPKPATNKPATTGAKPAATTAGANKPAAKGNAKDRLDLEASQITGNRELPKVLYIVPWRSAELGDLVGRPVNSLLDEVLEPVDRDVFRRQNRYFDALQPNEATQPKQPEK
jgi:hypothetical protein